MMTIPSATRRSFIRTTGVALSAPLAAAAATMPVGATDQGDSLEARLARLEDVEAIRALHQAYARQVNDPAAGETAALFADAPEVTSHAGIRRVVADGFGEQDVIEIAPDRTAATAQVSCSVLVETEIEPDCPLVVMAREQGGGVVRRTEHGVFENTYVRRDGIWKIQRVTYRPA